MGREDIQLFIAGMAFMLGALLLYTAALAEARVYIAHEIASARHDR